MQKHALSYGVHFNVTDTTRRLGQSGKKVQENDKGYFRIKVRNVEEQNLLVLSYFDGLDGHLREFHQTIEHGILCRKSVEPA